MMRASIDIGLPVYNGAETIERAIGSIRAQTLADFRLLVSDNASSDATVAIVERHAAEDPRIRLIRHAENQGPYDNFACLIRAAEAEFFVYLAADDWWSPTFLETTHAALAANADAVCCVPRVAFYASEAERLHVTPSTASITDSSPKDRLERFLLHPSDCSRFYGLHRRDVLAACFDDEGRFHAGDWYIVLLELRGGTHLEVPYVLLHRIATPVERYVQSWRESNAGRLRARTPLLPLRQQLKRKLPGSDYRAIAKALRRLDARLDREHRSVERRSVGYQGRSGE